MLAVQMSPRGYHWPVCRKLLENAARQVSVVGLPQGSKKARVLRGGSSVLVAAFECAATEIDESAFCQ